MLPALPSQPCTCSGAPLVGLRVALGEAVWGLQWPRTLPAHRCIRAERREGGERRLRELLFSSLGHPLPFLRSRKAWDLGGGGTEIPFICASSGESQL